LSTLKTNQILQIEGVILDKYQLGKHLENIAITHNLKEKSDKRTYPIPRLIENYSLIKEVYNLLNKNLKQDISIHPAGEWLLDNFYIIEQAVKQIKKDLSLKKYRNFVRTENWKISRVCKDICFSIWNSSIYR